MNRAEYITCIAKTYDPNTSWCGRNISMMFSFENIDHAQRAVAKGSRLTICPECWTTIQDVIDNEMLKLASQQVVQADAKKLATEIHEACRCGASVNSLESRNIEHETPTNNYTGQTGERGVKMDEIEYEGEDEEWSLFETWYDTQVHRFHYGQFSDKDIAYSEWLEGRKSMS